MTLRLTIIFGFLGLAGCPSEPCKIGWSEVDTGGTLDRVVLSAWESPSGQLYAVGGGIGVAGAKALALRFDGVSWEQLPVDGDKTLWWVWGSADDDVWMVGEQGLVVRWDGNDLSAVPSGTQATLFGVWGSGADDVWIVGGMPGTDGPDDVVLHWDGQKLAVDPTAPVAGNSLFKVWGSAANDVWVVGERGAIMHRDATGWRVDTDAMLTNRNLLTVAGCAANDVWAVGGDTVLRWEGATWAVAPEPVLAGTANGVSCGAAGVLVVGNGGLKWRRDPAGVWHDEQFDEPWNADFHGALVASDGNLWATGGNFNAPAAAGPRSGVIGLFSAPGCPH